MVDHFQLSFCCFHFKRTTNISNGSSRTIESKCFADAAWSAHQCITLDWIQCKWRLENRNKCKLRLFSPVNVRFCMCFSYPRWKSIWNLHFDFILCRISNGYFFFLLLDPFAMAGFWFGIKDDNGTVSDFKTTLGNTITRYAIQIHVQNQRSLCRRSEKRESDYPTIWRHPLFCLHESCATQTKCVYFFFIISESAA